MVRDGGNRQAFHTWSLQASKRLAQVNWASSTLVLRLGEMSTRVRSGAPALDALRQTAEPALAGGHGGDGGRRRCMGSPSVACGRHLLL